jgi:hypothetical protein
MKVFVSVVPTYDEIMGVGSTEQEAILVASRKACEYLHDTGHVRDYTDTPEKVAEYFGVFATEIEVGEATFVR